MANPLNPLAKELKKLTSKRNKTDADYMLISDLEWLASWYYESNQLSFAINNNGIAIGDHGRLILPDYVLDPVLVNGAKKNKLGMQFKSGVFVEGDAPLDIGTDKPLDQLMHDKNYRMESLETVGQARVLRTRPYIKQWSATFMVHYDDTVVNKPEIEQALDAAGRLVGACERRPKFGRFTYSLNGNGHK